MTEFQAKLGGIVTRNVESSSTARLGLSRRSRTARMPRFDLSHTLTHINKLVLKFEKSGHPLPVAMASGALINISLPLNYWVLEVASPVTEFCPESSANTQARLGASRTARWACSSATPVSRARRW